MHERNNTINYFNSTNKENEDSINVERNNLMDSPNSLHRKYSLEKRIRDFKKKISNDLNQNTNYNDLKQIDWKNKCKFFYFIF